MLGLLRRSAELRLRLRARHAGRWHARGLVHRRLELIGWILIQPALLGLPSSGRWGSWLPLLTGWRRGLLSATESLVELRGHRRVELMLGRLACLIRGLLE